MLKKLALALALFVSPAVLTAQEDQQTKAGLSAPLKQRAQDVVALLKGEAAPEDVFSEAFLTAVPPDQFAAINAQVTAQHGQALSVEAINPKSEFSGEVLIRFEKSIARLDLAVAPQSPHLIQGLLIRQFDTLDDSFAKIAAELNALPGEVGAYFGPLDGNDPLLAINPDKRFAIGSTFKLYVLAALSREIRQGKRSWDDVIALDQKSFPSGMMQNWPSGAPVTLSTLASLMISISDNTATDQLMSVLGREQVEQTVAESGYTDPAKTMPFLTTRELFSLKGGPAERLEAYRTASNTDEQRAILDDLATDDLTLEQINTAFAEGPVALDVEWFASATDLRRLFDYMNQTAIEGTFAIMEINPSVPEPLREKWDYIGYKGGSEPGVLNLTWLLTDRASKPHVLVLSWNNPEANLNNSALEMIAQRILQLSN